MTDSWGQNPQQPGVGGTQPQGLGQPAGPSFSQTGGQPNVPDYSQTGGQPNVPDYSQTGGQPNAAGPSGPETWGQPQTAGYATWPTMQGSNQVPPPPPGIPPNAAPPRKRTGMIIAIVAAIVAAGVLVATFIIVLNTRNARKEPTPASSSSSADPTSTQPTRTDPTSTDPTPQPTAGGSTAANGSFQNLVMPASFGGFSAGSEYGTGEWIGAPSGSTSVGWWYRGTIGSASGSIVASMVHNGSISELNPYSFENTTEVNGATCGTWLTRYDACFFPMGDGFIGIQVSSSDFNGASSRTDVLRLLSAFKAAV